MNRAVIIGGILDGRQRILEWGWLKITVANLVVIVLMVAVFVAALLVPFPRGRR